MSGKFPTFPNHHAACCFNCGARLVGPHFDADFPPGAGKFAAVCIGGCGMRTWYDVEPSHAEDKLDFPLSPWSNN